MKKHFIFSLCLLSCNFVTAQTPYTLNQLKDSALQHNLTLSQARRSVDAARQQRKEVFTNFFPNISATGLWFNANKGMAQTSINPSEVVPPELGRSLAASLSPDVALALANPISVSMMKNGTIAAVTAVQPVFAGGQIVNGNKLARVGEEAAQLQCRLSENEVEKTTEQYYWQMVSLQEKLRTVAAADTLLRGISHDVDVAVRAGVALSNDQLQIQLRLNDIESQHLQLRNALSVLRLAIAQYCGLRDTSFALSPVSCDAISTLPAYQTPSQALPATAEYQLLTKQVEAARLQRQVAVGQNLPSVAVGAGYNYHNLMDNNHTFGMLFATVSVPISDWWGGSHAIKRKKIEYQKALDQQRDKSELLNIRIQSAWNGVTEASQQFTICQRSVEQARENLRLNRNFYRAGTSKMSDLLEAQLLYQQSLDHRTDAFADYHNKLLEYRQAIGQ